MHLTALQNQRLEDLVLAWPGPALSKVSSEDGVSPIPSLPSLLEASSFDNDFEICNQIY